MKPGSKRELTALEIGYFPAIAIAPARYRIERKRDAGAHRVFAITATRSGARVTCELAVDDAVARKTVGTEVTTRVPPGPR
jgi:hypothetical protein